MAYVFNPFTGTFDTIVDASTLAAVAPATTARNTIQPTVNSASPITLKGRNTTTTASAAVFTAASANASVTGNTVTKTSADAWDCGAVSTLGIDTTTTTGYMTWTHSSTAKLMMCGLSADDPDYSYTGIDFAIYANSGTAYAYENGLNKATLGTITAATVMKVAIEPGPLVKYYLNGVLKYTSLVVPTGTCKIDCSIYSNGGALTAMLLADEGRQTANLLPFYDGAGVLIGFFDNTAGLSLGVAAMPTSAKLALQDGHIATRASITPNIVAGALTAGTGGSASLLSNSNDVCGLITLNTGTAAWAAGGQVTVTFNRPYANAPRVVITPANGAAATAMRTREVYVSSTITAFVLFFNVADVAATSYNWHYMCIEG